MIVKGFILYKGKKFLPCRLVIKDGEIVQYDSDNFNVIFPQENRSALSKIETIKKVHQPQRIPKNCRFFIQHFINDEVMNIYLEISQFNYWRLKWQLKTFLIQTKEFKVGLIITFITAILGLLVSILT